MKNNYLYNKTVIITGASGGLGFALAKRLIEKYRCKIIGIGRNEKKFIKNIKILGENSALFSYYIFDVSLKENWDNFYKILTDKNIKPDVLINNAGFMLPFKKFDNISDEEIEEIIKTDLLSDIYAVKALLPLLKNSKTPAIINVSSAAGICAVVGESMYCTVKFAVRGFTETLAQEYRKQIYVGGVYPGFINTDLFSRMELKDSEKKKITRFMMPVDSAAKKIVKRISKKKRITVLGIDGHSMSVFSRFFPKATPNLITKVLKKSGLSLFNDTFDN